MHAYTHDHGYRHYCAKAKDYIASISIHISDHKLNRAEACNPLTSMYIMKCMHSKRKRQKTGFQRIPLYKKPRYENY